MDKRFEAIEERLDKMDKRFETIEERLDKMDKKFVTIEKRIDELDKRLTKELRELSQRIAVLEEEYGRKLDILYETRVEQMEKQELQQNDIKKLEHRISILEYRQ